MSPPSFRKIDASPHSSKVTISQINLCLNLTSSPSLIFNQLKLKSITPQLYNKLKNLEARIYSFAVTNALINGRSVRSVVRYKREESCIKVRNRIIKRNNWRVLLRSSEGIRLCIRSLILIWDRDKAEDTSRKSYTTFKAVKNTPNRTFRPSSIILLPPLIKQMIPPQISLSNSTLT